MILELGLSLIGIGLTIPALVDDFMDTFDLTNWRTWVKIIPQIILLFACGFRFVKKLQTQTLITSIMAMLGSYFLLLFNTRESSDLICDYYGDLCAETVNVLCTGEVLHVSTALPYLIGIAFLIVGSTLLAREAYFALENEKVEPNDFK
ncbi:unnamed protein product [Blepharisma stoltei]|uniref:Uncharacterized protein n=1 Tax=Blepharisma stoltei TaxID=1481888 RepID=A0AAU9IQU5_9CILI|nr:unnamed protein product [Blepharisma stoltei]